MTAEQRKTLETMLKSTETMLKSTETKLKDILNGEDIEAGYVMGLEIEIERLKRLLQEDRREERE